ncbi:MAG: metalloprotease family protein [Dehalococcoidia bacterium]|nr:metalloprotease family protein [Dehalococcoidia bacterium]
MFGWLIALITFPGIILHEWAHKFFCDRTKIPVYKTCYFRLGNPAGYVIHGPVDNYGKAFLIATAPFLVNTIVSVISFIIALILPLGLAAYILCWLGITVAMHSFPSSQDADNLWSYSKEGWRRNPLVLLSFPIIGLIKLAGLLRSVWFDLLYAVALLLLVAFIIKGGNLF